MFIGRHKELNELTEKLNNDKFESILLYGRRRIGKTELIKEAAKSFDGTFIYYECKHSLLGDNIEAFNVTLRMTLKIKFTFETMKDALNFVSVDTASPILPKLPPETAELIKSPALSFGILSKNDIDCTPKPTSIPTRGWTRRVYDILGTYQKLPLYSIAFIYFSIELKSVPTKPANVLALSNIVFIKVGNKQAYPGTKFTLTTCLPLIQLYVFVSDCVDIGIPLASHNWDMLKTIININNNLLFINTLILFFIISIFWPFIIWD